jgi:hypothetical protein
LTTYISTPYLNQKKKTKTWQVSKVTIAFLIPHLPTPSHPTQKFVPPKKCILDFFSQMNNMSKPSKIIIIIIIIIKKLEKYFCKKIKEKTCVKWVLELVPGPIPNFGFDFDSGSLKKN